MSVLQLFLWPLKGTADVKVDGETFDEALTRINSNINSLLRLTNFIAGNISVLTACVSMHRCCSLKIKKLFPPYHHYLGFKK